MREMVFICEGEEVSIKTMCDFLCKTKVEILEMGRGIGKNKTLKIDNYEYKVKYLKGKQKPKSYYKPVEFKKSGGRNKIIDITNIVKDKGCLTHKRKYYIDGKLTSKINIADELGISLTYLTTQLARVKRLTINKHDIIIKSDEPYYTPIKDGVKYKRCNAIESGKISGLDQSTVKDLYKSKNYSRKDGWRFI